MSDVRRWAADEMPHHDEGGLWVLYADHVAAVAAAEQRAGEESHGHYMDGYNAAWSLSAAEIERQTLKAARDAVDGKRRSYYADCVNDGHQPDPRAIAAFRLSLAAIDGVEK